MSSLNLSPSDIQRIKDALPTMPDAQKRRALELLTLYYNETRKVASKNSFLEFILWVYPGYIIGPHHRRLAELFEDIAAGRKKRVTVSIAPRHGKSEMISYLAPAWYLGKYPHKKVIMASHTADLAISFGRRVRNLVDSDRYKDIFPQVQLQPDSKSASRWGTNMGGEYFAIGVGGALAGRGADLFIIDDPHALPLDTEISTPGGFKTIGQLQVGDQVFGPDGLPTQVIAKSDIWHDREIYEVCTDDGEQVLCDGEHLWTYHSETNLKNSHLLKTATARELAQWDKPNKPYLPRHEAVQYPEAPLPIDPYVLGAWLGDGTSSLGRMTAHPDDAPFMREQFEKAGYITTDLQDDYSFGVLKLRAQLTDAGLLNTKHIPTAYLTASVPQRVALLQGLMDTDGTVTTAGECSFQNTNRKLVEGVQQLLHSLGHKARINVYHDNRKIHRTRKPDYRVNFKMQDCCRMPRKAGRTFTSEDKRRRAIEVRNTGLKGSVQCITVDRPDGLFLVGRGYVVTHNSEQEAMSGRSEVFAPAYEWFQAGPQQRLMPGGAIIIVGTRWNKADLIGKVIDHSLRNDDSEPWEVLEFPAVFEDEHTHEYRSLWPEFWPIEELLKKKAGMDPRYWSAQYLQDPTSEEGALVKREWWRVWESDKPPQCEFIIMSLDAAQETNNRADYNALTTWGVFMNEEEKGYQIILLNVIRKRLEFPELKAMVLEEYTDWEPDSFIVEKKSNGAALYQEMRRMGLPVAEFTPGKGADKISRVNSVSDLFSSGMVWAPDTRWARELIEEVASFPSGEFDDQVDSMSLALMRFRQGGFVRLPSDMKDEPQFFKSHRSRGYYQIL